MFATKNRFAVLECEDLEQKEIDLYEPSINDVIKENCESDSENDFWDDSESEIDTDYDEKEYETVHESVRPQSKMEVVWRRVIVKKFHVVKKYIETNNSEEDIRCALSTFFCYHPNLSQKNKFYLIFDHYMNPKYENKYVMTEQDFHLYITRTMLLICFDYIDDLFKYVELKQLSLNFDRIVSLISEIDCEVINYFSNQNELNALYMVLEKLYQLGVYKNPNDLYEKFKEIHPKENFETFESTILKFCTMYFNVQTLSLYILERAKELHCDYYENDVIRIYTTNKHLIENKQITIDVLSNMFNLDFSKLLEKHNNCLPILKYQFGEVEKDEEDEWNEFRIKKVDYSNY